ncbi:nucleotidyltransferase family protein [Flectobacillus roseus]|uniref:nucleotidyltransferase family protein n=1 Tax=Flectobacillus roseus TaxID=502259 RepID=UPI0024B7A9A5|nr:nucleotidyltransferase domain-containing protein [Flectobacillus roseus]MDI9867779.1 nucleotidyltransferase domain-containing protein [Flectobacillus roseus]
MQFQKEILKPEFQAMCQKHNVLKLFAFGSAITDRFDDQNSDIDLLVEIDEKDPIERGEKLMSLWDTFENFFHKKVDLLTESSIRNPYLKRNIDATKVLIYDREGTKIFV